MKALRETSTSDEALDFLMQLQQRRLAAEKNVAQLENMGFTLLDVPDLFFLRETSDFNAALDRLTTRHQEKEPALHEAERMTRAATTEREGADEPHRAALELESTPELLNSDDIDRWGVIHGLQRAPHRNSQMVQVGAPRSDGRIVTTRPTSGDELGVRRENLRELMRSYGGLCAGDVVDLEGTEVFLLGFAHVRGLWACETESDLENGEVQTQYVLLPAEQLHATS